METRHELDKQVAVKLECKTVRRRQEEIELKLQQQTDEAVKKSDANIEKAKKYETQQQKEFLRVDLFCLELHEHFTKIKRKILVFSIKSNSEES